MEETYGDPGLAALYRVEDRASLQLDDVRAVLRLVARMQPRPYFNAMDMPFRLEDPDNPVGLDPLQGQLLPTHDEIVVIGNGQMQGRSMWVTYHITRREKEAIAFVAARSDTDVTSGLRDLTDMVQDGFCCVLRTLSSNFRQMQFPEATSFDLTIKVLLPGAVRSGSACAALRCAMVCTQQARDVRQPRVRVRLGSISSPCAHAPTIQQVFYLRPDEEDPSTREDSIVDCRKLWELARADAGFI